MAVPTILETIIAVLNQEEVEFEHITHEPTLTSTESAAARGEEEPIGAKALVMRLSTKNDYAVFVVNAAYKVNSKAIRDHFRERRIRFAKPEELLELTGLVRGSVPPFGQPILPMALYVDPTVLDNKKIAFNAGSVTDSIIMNTDDWEKIARPKIFDFSMK